MSQPEPLTEQQLDEIETRAAHLHEYACQDDGEGDTLAGTDVPLLVAEVRRLRTKARTLGELAARRESELIGRRAELERVRRIARRLAAHAVGFGDVLDDSDHDPWAKTVGADIAELAAAVAPDAASEATTAPLAASQPSEAPGEGETATRAATGRVGDPRRTLTPNEYSAAWHAVEGAAGEEGADPGTVLHAVLNRLGIDTPATEAGR